MRPLAFEETGFGVSAGADWCGQTPANQFERAQRALRAEGLDQIIECVYFERAAHIFLVRRCEYEYGTRVAVLNDARAFNAGKSGHFNVHQNNLRLRLIV